MTTIKRDLMATYSCPKCGSVMTTRLNEPGDTCQKIRCKHCGYEGSPFAQMEDALTPEDDIAGYGWTCPNCGHHSYTIRTYNEPGDYHEGLGTTPVLVCTCCGYEV
jgi:predicted RNA-binding Zn-ribbon protein involved in translation (DUF1610 family)